MSEPLFIINFVTLIFSFWSAILIGTIITPKKNRNRNDNNYNNSKVIFATISSCDENHDFNISNNSNDDNDVKEVQRVWYTWLKKVYAKEEKTWMGKRSVEKDWQRFDNRNSLQQYDDNRNNKIDPYNKLSLFITNNW